MTSPKRMLLFAVWTCCMCLRCEGVPIEMASEQTTAFSLPRVMSSEILTPTTTPSLLRHKLIKITAKPKQAYIPNNGTLMISGDSTMHVFDYHEIIHPKFDPSSVLKQASRESTQKIEVPLNYGQHYFIFLPPALIKEYQKFSSRNQSRKRRRFKRHHPSILQSVLGELQDYALVPIQSSSGQVRYVLLKNPKFVISGVGPNGKPVSASIPVTQQPNNPLSMVQSPPGGQQSGSSEHHSTDTHRNPAPLPITNQKVLPQITNMMSPLKIGPVPKTAPPTPAPWTPPTRTRSRTQRLTRNNRPVSASVAKKAILGERPSSDRKEGIIVPRPSSINRMNSIGRRGPSRNIRPTPNFRERQETSLNSRPAINRNNRQGSNRPTRPVSRRMERIERPVPAAGPIDALFNENVATHPPVHHVSHVHSQSRGHIQSQTIHTAPHSSPRVDTMTQNAQTSGQASSIMSSSGSTSSMTSSSGGGASSQADSALSGMSDVGSTLHSVSGGVGDGTGTSTPEGNGTHIVHHTEVVETVIETKNQAAAVAKTDTAAVTNQSTSVSSKGGNSGSPATSQTSASSAASASTAVASKQEQVVSTKKTTKTTQIKKGTDANGQPAAVHEVTEVVEHTSAAKTGAATATKTDAAAATASSSSAVGTNGGSSGGAATVDSASASSAASGSASVTSNNATTTSVKTTIKKTTVTKTVGNGTVVEKVDAPITGPLNDNSKSMSSNIGETNTAKTKDVGSMTAQDAYKVDTGSTGVGDASATMTAERLAVKALDLYIPSLQKEKKNKKKAKTAILSESNDRQAVGVKAALIATPEPKLAAKIVESNTASYPSTTPVPTTPEPQEEFTTTESVPTTTEEMELEEYPTTMSSQTTMAYYDAPMTSFTSVAGWAGPTTSSALGPNDRLNTTDVPEEIEARPDKTPAEMRHELEKLNPNMKKEQSGKQGPGAKRNSRQRPANPKGTARAKKAQRKRQNLKARRNKANSSRNNPRRRGGRGRANGAGTRPRTADPVARWLWNNMENTEMFENMPLWMLLR